MLREAGYVTAYIGNWHLREDDPGFFDVWKGFNSLEPHWLGEKYASPYRPDVETDAGIEFLEQHRDKPFLLFQSYYPPHTPFTVPKRFHALYEGTDLEPMEYYAAVSDIDWNVGRLLAKLDELGLRERTVVSYTSEHGVTIPAGLHGKSLVGPLRRGEDNWSEPVVIQNIPHGKINEAGAIERAVRTRQWKLITRQLEKTGQTPPFELYNLLADPGEEADLFGRPEHTAVVREHCKHLTSWGQRVGDKMAVNLAQAARAAAGDS